MREWLELSEIEFHLRITERMRETGSVGDVIPAMITYNVPGFILKELWPEGHAYWIERPVFMAFAVAEDGWGGRIDRVTSQLKDIPGDGTVADRFELTFAKSYVIECEEMLILARGDFPGGEEFALCRVQRQEVSKPGAVQTWESRGDPGVLLETSDGRTVDHYRVRGTASLSPVDVLPLTRRRYTPPGIRIPRRELTSLSLISIALLEHLELKPKDGADADLLADRAQRILSAREVGRLSGNEMRAAVEILDVFFRVTDPLEPRPQALHPFWEKVREMRRRFDRSEKK